MCAVSQPSPKDCLQVGVRTRQCECGMLQHVRVWQCWAHTYRGIQQLCMHWLPSLMDA